MTAGGAASDWTRAGGAASDWTRAEAALLLSNQCAKVKPAIIHTHSAIRFNVLLLLINH